MVFALSKSPLVFLSIFSLFQDYQVSDEKIGLENGNKVITEENIFMGYFSRKKKLFQGNFTREYEEKFCLGKFSKENEGEKPSGKFSERKRKKKLVFGPFYESKRNEKLF